MPRKNILALLDGGDRRSIGRADEVAATVSKNHALFPRLMQGWWSEDPLVRMRAADASEKITRKEPDLLRPYKKELLALMAKAEQQELRWHLAAIVPRLPLNSKERQLVFSLLRRYLEDGSSIVKTCALQALADLAVDDSSIRLGVMEILRQSIRKGTPGDEGAQPQVTASLGSGLLMGEGQFGGNPWWGHWLSSSGLERTPEGS
jgi:hypothetical protein